MYYTEKEHNIDNLYSYDILKRQNQLFKSNIAYESELFKLMDEIYIPKDTLNKYEILDHTITYIGPTFKIPDLKLHIKDEYINKDYGDTELYEWLKLQQDTCIAILAEIVNAPKLSLKIEKIRPEVKHMDTITIDEYRKIKCIGSKKVEWLKQLKKKYGINILRFLKMSITK